MMRRLARVVMILAVPAVVAALAVSIRLSCLDWGDLHPDRRKMDRWMRITLHEAAQKDQVYPGGFFTLFRPLHRWHVARRLREERALAAAAAAAAAPDRATVEAGVHVILLARKFNVALAGLTVVILFYLALGVTRSAGAAALSALLLAFHPFHIEHSCYAQTDIAMLFTLSLSLLLWCRAAGRYRWPWFAAAALVSGFAAGTKYPLVWLGLLVPATACAPGTRGGTAGSRWKACTVAVAGGLALFAAGFVWANPAVLDPAWFFTRLRTETAGVLLESPEVVGPAFGKPLARFCHQVRFLGSALAALGWPWLASAAAGLAWCLGRQDRRRRARPLLLFTALYLGYLLAVAPWIRMQETFALVPLLAVAAGGAAALVRALSGRRGGWVPVRLALGILVAAAALDTVRRGLRRETLMETRDSRVCAERWLQRHLPQPDRALGLEMHTRTRAGYPLPVSNTLGLYKVEQHAWPATAARCDYVLCNATMSGRGILNPFTGKRYDVYEANRRAFLAGSERLRSWSPAPPENDVTFAFPNCELQLYGTRRFAPGPALEAPVPRPVRFVPDGSVYGYAEGYTLGVIEGLELRDGQAGKFVAGGPADPPPPFYLLIRCLEGPARVTLRTAPRRRRRRVLRLQAGQTVWARLDSPARPLRVSAYRKTRLRVAGGGGGGGVARCQAWGSFCPVETAAWLHLLGADGQAAELLARHGGGRRSGAMLAALLKGRDASAANRVPASQTALLHRAAAAQEDVTAYTLNGITAYYRQEFARHIAYAAPGGTPPGLSLLTPPGRWSLRCEAAVPESAVGAERVRLAAVDAQGNLLAAPETFSMIGPGVAAATVGFDVERPCSPAVNLGGPGAARVKLRRVELRWRVADRLAWLAQALDAAGREPLPLHGPGDGAANAPPPAAGTPAR